MEYTIETDRLTKYFSSRRVVDQMDLRVPRGCVYALLGRNGAGKTTTIRMLTGMLAPDSGAIRIFGQSPAELTVETKARVTYLAENQPLYGWMTVGEILRFTRRFYPMWKETLVEELLDHYAISRQAKLRRLSHGQRAQVALALAVAPDPDLLILDDPTLGLDTVVRRDFLEVLIQIIQREGRTILFSSHILNDVERVADRIGILVDGVLRVDCPIDEFKEAVRRVTCEFSGAPPAIGDAPGLVQARRTGQRAELVFVRFGAEQQRFVESLSPRHWEVVDLNLEDAFIEYTRRGRPAALSLSVDPQPAAT